MDAVASNTLFIHGSISGGGGTQFLNPAKLAGRPGRMGKGSIYQCKEACGRPNYELSLVGTSTVCDRTCDAPGSSGRFEGLLCGAGDAEEFGIHCRLCYTDVAEARKAEEALRSDNRTAETGVRGKHVIMCDTLRPPQAAVCSEKCARKVDTVRGIAG